MKNIYTFPKIYSWLCLIILLWIPFGIFSQEILVNPHMDDTTGWTIYNLGSASPAAYEFNYSASKPSHGMGGCLHVTSPVKTNILFWQKIKLKAGKSYVVDGAVKINNVASFWCETYLSTVPPAVNTDYAPNNNGDVVRGFSTWSGCGPNVDGLFSKDACTGKRIYVPAGNPDEQVEVFFALKTGSMANPLPNPMEVLIDELSVKLIQDSILLSTREGVIDTLNLKITGVSPFLTAEQFHAGLHVAPTASVDLVGKTGKLPIPRQDSVMISDSMMVKVTGLNGITCYPIELRSVSSKNLILSVSLGMVDQRHSRLLFIPFNTRVIQLKSALRVSPFATYEVLDKSGNPMSGLQLINHHAKVVVTAENGSQKAYAIDLLPLPIFPRYLCDYKDTFQVIRNKDLVLKGNTEIHVTASENPLEGSILDLKSDNVWLYFPNIKPSVFYDKYFGQILVHDTTAILDENIRLVQYRQGTVIISQSSSYLPLEVFTGENLAGSSIKLGIYNYYRSQELGSMNDTIKSFRLKKGYMATLAKDDFGTGYSRNYVAADSDVIINKLPVGLYDSVSFIRVIPWRWVSKKGWTSGPPSAEALNCLWQYDWNNTAISSLNVEYIPMRHNKYWNSYDNIHTKRNSTHALGFNEPDKSDQANMTVSEAIEQWPELLKSGLRLGSPAPSDGGLDWLYQFIDRCDALNYRVDFVAMHWYQGGQSPKQFYDRIKAIHDRTGRPIWITEWNNGANWTCCKPTYESQAAAIGKFIEMLDTTSFVERYSLYEWVEDTRHMFYKAPVLLTPAGEVYRDQKSPLAFNPATVFTHEYVVPPVPPKEYIGPAIGFDYGKALSVDIDNDGDLDIVYSGCDPYVAGILKNDGIGNFVNTNQPFQGLYIPSISAGDPDGDGDLDILVSGWDRAHSWPAWARIFRNDGSGTFTLETIPSINAPAAGFADLDNNGFLDYYMVGNGNNNNKFYFQKPIGFDAPVGRLSNGNNMGDPDVTAVDLDNDQDVDFCMEAYNKTTSKRYTQIWKNDGNGLFTEQTVLFKQKHWGSAQFADIDSDGDLDMLLNGDGDSNSDGGSSDVYRLYLNNGSGYFTEGASFQKYRQNTNGKGSCFVDWDNDGDYDIILTGWSASENKEVTNIYLNNGTGVFAKSSESLNIPGINRGTVELGDFNNDHKTDLLINGYSGGGFARTVAFLIKNSSVLSNTLPVAPKILQTVVSGDTVFFSWSAGSDAETHPNGLTYNLYIKDVSGKYYVFPNANTSTGKRMVCGLGNAFQNLGWKLKGLPSGTYAWSVQTIDAAYEGSPFAPQATFTVGSSLKSLKFQEPVFDEKTNSVDVYPNPVERNLTLKNVTGLSRITIYSIDGLILMDKKVNESEKIHVENLPAGVYNIRIQNNDQSVIRKFVKK